MSTSLFASKAEISFPIVLGKSKSSAEKLYCDVNEKEIKAVAGDDLEEKLETITFFAKSPSFADSNAILDGGVGYSGGENLEIHPGKMRQRRIEVLITGWQFEGAEKIKATPDLIRELDPRIAFIVGYQLDNALRDRGLI